MCKVEAKRMVDDSNGIDVDDDVDDKDVNIANERAQQRQQHSQSPSTSNEMCAQCWNLFIRSFFSFNLFWLKRQECGWRARPLFNKKARRIFRMSLQTHTHWIAIWLTKKHRSKKLNKFRLCRSMLIYICNRVAMNMWISMLTSIEKWLKIEKKVHTRASARAGKHIRSLVHSFEPCISNVWGTMAKKKDVLKKKFHRKEQGKKSRIHMSERE